MRFIRLTALQQHELNKLIRINEPARNLYTGRSIPLQDIFAVYRHLYRHRASEDMPPMDE